VEASRQDAQIDEDNFDRGRKAGVETRNLYRRETAGERKE